MPHILIDFDRTLATYESWEKNGSSLGAPIPATVERVKRWLSAGKDVRIFTARAAENNPRKERDVAAIRAWCLKHVGHELPVTNQKDFETTSIWDDLAVALEPNTGWRLGGSLRDEVLNSDEEIKLSGFEGKMDTLVG